jgi:hypothetical protein
MPQFLSIYIFLGSNGRTAKRHQQALFLNPTPTTSHWPPSQRQSLIKMGFWDTITDLVEAATPWATAEAEAPAQDEQVCT